MKLLSPRKVAGGYRLDMDPITTDAQFVRMIEILEENFETEILSKIDGPDARIWKLNIDKNIPVEANYYSSIGNWFFVKEDIGIDILMRIKKLFDNILS